MIYHGVTCERVQPPAPEAYICSWQDRNTLALGLLQEGKGSRLSDHQAIKDAQGIVGRRFAMVTVETVGHD